MDTRSSSSTLYLLTKMDAQFIQSVPAASRLQYPFVIQDTTEFDACVRNWRVMPFTWSSASAAPNQQHFAWIKDEINKLTAAKVKKIVIVDLREESHGYLNGQAINLTAPNNWINRGKNYDDVIRAENEWLQSLKSKHFAEVYSHVQLDNDDIDISDNMYAISSINSECDVVESYDMEYFRITVSDHCAPDDKDVDRFLDFVDNMTEDTWLHFHCRGGAGRSTTFLAMFYMLKFANKVAFDNIIDRHKSIPPYYDLTTGSRINTHLQECYQQRYQFLKRFYEFARARLNHYPHSWSQWVKDSEHDIAELVEPVNGEQRLAI